MKLYIGKNKKSAKEITLKNAIYKTLKIKGAEIDQDRFSDDSSSWIYFRQKVETGVIDIEIHFDPETDNSIEEIGVWKYNYVIDEDNGKKII